MPYKQVFARLYPNTLGERNLVEMFAFLPDGRLSIRLATAPELIDIGPHGPSVSTPILSGGGPVPLAQTIDGAFQVEVEAAAHRDITEFWLFHTDKANNKFKRVKLNTEWPASGNSQPRVAVAPSSSFFIADDSGTVRLYSVEDLQDIGAFQIAHPNTENRIVAMAVSPEDRLIAGLSSWKDIVLYDLSHRKVVFVRQIRDNVGWYDPSMAHIIIDGNAEVIITVGLSHETDHQNQTNFSVNAFRYIPLSR